MKKIYFSCSISGGRDHAHVYQDIVDNIKAAGLHVLSEIFADKTIKAEHGPTRHLTDRQIWERDFGWVRQADGVIAEATQPSFGVGYEIAKAEQFNKPVLVLFYKDSGRRLSPMLSGDPNVTVFGYADVAETKDAITAFIARL
ncbi:MAG TPA: nucleoside 2-deoxyribosyltransferase [Candidatus Saccharimonadales bacterium]|nr:nucleoside 2-deoxyribosyltransferase [Candidatus Saccharimonadales bacterium]